MIKTNWIQITLRRENEWIDKSVPICPRQGVETLLSVLQTLWADHQIDHCSRIMTHRGPGSFTSTRLALAVAQGLSIGYDCFCLCPTRFELWSRILKDYQPILMTIDAHNGSFFSQLLQNNQIISYGLLTPETLKKQVLTDRLNHYGEFPHLPSVPIADDCESRWFWTFQKLVKNPQSFHRFDPDYQGLSNP